MATQGLIVPGAGAGRKQVPLKPGHSLMHWVQLNNRKGRAMSGLPPGQRPGPISAEELARHQTEDDCWMCIQGRVYNITPYMHFHPGGIAELMRGAGEDATVMFQEAHAWVNFDGFLEKCLVGYMAQDRPHGAHSGTAAAGGARKAKPSSNDRLAAAVTKPSLGLSPGATGLAVPRKPGLTGLGWGKKRTAAARGSVGTGNPAGRAAADMPVPAAPRATVAIAVTAVEELPPPAQQQPPMEETDGAAAAAPASTGKPASEASAPGLLLPLPNRDWYQTDHAVTLVLYKVLEPPALLSNVTVHIEGNALHVSVTTRAGQYRLLLLLENEVVQVPPPKLRASGSNLTVELVKVAVKAEASAQCSTQWRELGSVLVEAHNAVDEARSTFHPCAIIEIVQISPDTKTLVLAPRRSEAAGARDWHFGAGQHLIVKRMEPGYTGGGGGGSGSGGGSGGYTTRSYTPIGSGITVLVPGRELAVEQAFELLVKVYPQGQLSSYIGGLRVGDDLLCTRAVGGGDIPAGLAEHGAIGFIAGGTGITPMLPIMQAMGPGQQGHLVFCNRAEQDILMLDRLEKLDPTRFRTTHLLSSPDPQRPWTGLTGHISAEIIAAALPAPSSTSPMVVFVCGRLSFTKLVVGLLERLGHTSHIFS